MSNKRGRPRKIINARTKEIRVRLTEEEAWHLKHTAEAFGVSRSDILRQALYANDVSVYLIIEDVGFYSDDDDRDDKYISIDDINSAAHVQIHAVVMDPVVAEGILNSIIKQEESDWETKAIKRSVYDPTTKTHIEGSYLLGSFFYILRMPVI